MEFVKAFLVGLSLIHIEMCIRDRDTPKQRCCENYQIKIGSGRNLMTHGGPMNRAMIKPVGDLWGLPLTE